MLSAPKIKLALHLVLYGILSVYLKKGLDNIATIGRKVFLKNVLIKRYLAEDVLDLPYYYIGWHFPPRVDFIFFVLSL